MKLVNIDQTIKLLKDGGVVAIPTETVYGLGGWIHSEVGLKNIFSTKERPFFDPLIVHIDSIQSAKKLVSEWTHVHEALAQACWPGPLTLIAKKNDLVHPLITAGLDSVGLRCPRHELTLKLLSQIDGGIAAPSANKFGKTSPTNSKHVDDEFKGQVAILEGGPSEVGIESTVAGVKIIGEEFLVEIYRPGFYTANDLLNILKLKGIKAQVQYAESPVAPGQLKHHYMPKIPLVIVPTTFQWETDRKKIEDLLQHQFFSVIKWILPQEANMASRELYQKLREFDEKGHDLILVSKQTHHNTEEWMGIWNRLSKAKTLQI